jgi:tetratricopeptide (TPR) repeat protein
MEMPHLHITGERRADRLRCVAEHGPHTVIASCHRNLRGPYTGVDTVLRAVLPEARQRWPELIEAHRMELLYGMPELAELIGPAPRTLASAGPFEQRTRYYGVSMIRCMSQGVVTFLINHARRLAATGAPAPSLVFEDLRAAERTAQELVALLVRRADPAELRVVASEAGAELPTELAGVLARFARPVRAATGDRGPDRRTPEELARAYVWADGTGDDPAEHAAYLAADPHLRRTLHDRRAAELTSGASRGTLVGALAYHREHGTDPGGAGLRALFEAFQFCVEAGFSASVVDLGTRFRAIADPVADADRFRLVTNHTGSALVGLGRLDEAMELYQELRRRYTSPKVHATASYAIAMLYTRFFRPRDHDAALGWQNNACALASLLPDPDERRTLEVFHANGLALIEMHRGNLDRALELVTGCQARLDAELGAGEWALHRSQLLYNRARLLAALGRSDEAYAAFTTLIELDPYYTDYLSERAKISRRRGDVAAALADYDRAVALAPPFPELYYNRGTARVQTGDVDGALGDFDYVLEMEPDDLDTRLCRAEVLLDKGMLDEAEADVVAGAAIRPDEPRLLCLWGGISLERDEPAAALRQLDAALAADPDYPAALVNHAVAHYRLSNPLAAAEDLTRALELTGDDPDVLLNRGMAYAAAGRLEAALRDFTAALALPDADIVELLHQQARCQELLAGV